MRLINPSHTALCCTDGYTGALIIAIKIRYSGILMRIIKTVNTARAAGAELRVGLRKIKPGRVHSGECRCCFSPRTPGRAACLLLYLRGTPFLYHRGNNFAAALPPLPDFLPVRARFQAPGLVRCKRGAAPCPRVAVPPEHRNPAMFHASPERKSAAAPCAPRSRTTGRTSGSWPGGGRPPSYRADAKVTA